MNSLGWKIGQLIISILLIAGGLSGEMVLRGTNSSTALVVFGFGWLIWDIYKLATHGRDKRKKEEEAQAALERAEKEEAKLASSGDTLQTPALLTVVRDSSMVGAWVALDVFLNGMKAASIKNGKSAQITVKRKHNTLSVGVSTFEFDAEDGAVGELHINGFKGISGQTLKWQAGNAARTL